MRQACVRRTSVFGMVLLVYVFKLSRSLALKLVKIRSCCTHGAIFL